MHPAVYHRITELKKQNKKSFAVLVDPDKTNLVKADELISLCTSSKVDFIFVGGSLVVSDHLEDLVKHFKKECDIPVVLFPGSPSQVTPYADALLYLSLISGRNPELLIGQGAPTTVSYISNANPIPADKNEIAVCTAMAGEMLGLKLLYMDAGSGAKTPITQQMIQSVAGQISIPLIVGGGIRDAEKAYNNCKAGADLIVIGNAIEKDPHLIKEMSDAIHACSGFPLV
jgi:putative glycerol-1-phosphate prenyltransferase